MRISNTSERLIFLMKEQHLRQIDIINLCKPLCDKYNEKIPKNALSQYISGKVIPGQRKLYILAEALNVSEAWLMGFDVPMKNTVNLNKDKKAHVNEFINNLDEQSFCKLEDFLEKFFDYERK